MTGAGFTVRKRTRSGSAVAAPATGDEAGSTARLLAIAHAVDRLVEAGALARYGDGARRLGISHVRMSNICALMQLAPDIQEAILDGLLVTTERVLRPVYRVADWKEQRRFWRLQP